MLNKLVHHRNLVILVFVGVCFVYVEDRMSDWAVKLVKVISSQQLSRGSTLWQPVVEWEYVHVFSSDALDLSSVSSSTILVRDCRASLLSEIIRFVKLCLCLLLPCYSTLFWQACSCFLPSPMPRVFTSNIPILLPGLWACHLSIISLIPSDSFPALWGSQTFFYTMVTASCTKACSQPFLVKS